MNLNINSKQFLLDQFEKFLHTNEYLKSRVNQQQQDTLVDYVLLIEKWNKAYNLTAIKNIQQMFYKHIVDSLLIAEYIRGKHFVDIGTGAGLPGVVLAVIFPEKEFTLIDSRGKKTRFLNHVKHHLNINNIDPVNTRIEDYKEKKFDGILSRAFSSLELMLELSSDLSTVDSCFYAMKGVYPKEEIREIEQKIIDLDVKHIESALLNSHRTLVMFKKKKVHCG